jgi:hypothetical protein
VNKVEVEIVSSAREAVERYVMQHASKATLERFEEEKKERLKLLDEEEKKEKKEFRLPNQGLGSVKRSHSAQIRQQSKAQRIIGRVGKDLNQKGKNNKRRRKEESSESSEDEEGGRSAAFK